MITWLQAVKWTDIVDGGGGAAAAAATNYRHLDSLELEQLACDLFSIVCDCVVVWSHRDCMFCVAQKDNCISSPNGLVRLLSIFFGWFATVK